MLQLAINPSNSLNIQNSPNTLNIQNSQLAINPSNSQNSPNIQNSQNTIINDITHLPMREWVLKRSEALGGDFTVRTNKEFYLDPVLGLKYGDITYSAGLAKIFDEAITNATDNYNRNPYLNEPIEVEISDKHFRIKNYGATIPLIKEYNTDLHCEYYKPEMAFSVFQSSSNYDDSIVRTSNGKNGVGIKLANVFAVYFEVNIVNNNMKYHQTFQNNMDPNMTSEPLITPCQNEKDSVEIICYPDFPKLHITGITDGNLYHLLFRTFSCVAFGRDIYINNQKFSGMTFNNYAKILAPIYLNCSNEDITSKYEKYELITKDSSALIYVVPSKYHTQFSYVNTVYTADNGTHITKLLKDIRDIIELPESKSIKSKIKQNMLKNTKKIKQQSPTNFLLVFLNQTVENAQFDGQAKNRLTSKNITTDFSPIAYQLKQSVILRNYMNGNSSGRSKIAQRTFYKKCNSANKAGGPESLKCTLFITEGDSATGMVDKGFSQLGHDYYGVYTLRGKVINVRKATTEKVDANEIITNLFHEIGLERGLTYTSKKGLRYGRIVMVKDADVDGDAIMGLVYNAFYTYFKPLVMLGLNSDEGPFFYEFTTPAFQIIFPKEKGQPFSNKLEFTTQKEFEKSLKECIDKGLIKADDDNATHYMKGLGAIADEDVARYFNNIDSHLIPITVHDEIFPELKQCNLIENKLNEVRSDKLNDIRDNIKLIQNKLKNINENDYLLRNNLLSELQQNQQLLDFFSKSENKIPLPEYITVDGKYYQISKVSLNEYLTNQPNVFKEYANIIYGGMKADNYMKMVYGNDKCDIKLRKNWVMNCDPKKVLERADGMVELPITLFQHLSNVHFALDDCNRSMINIIDGLKPVYRKILYTLFSHPSTSKKFQKVSSLTGSTMSFAKYAHGDGSLEETIFTMMRNWAGSNNIPFLKNLGGIGSRLDLGVNHAQARYVSTSLSKIARLIYVKEDDPILTPTYEEGKKVEPEFYVPIIPISLINGSCGIGVGFSNFIPNHNQYDCINYIKKTLNIPENLQQLKIFPNSSVPIRPYYPECENNIVEADRGRRGYISYGSQQWIMPQNIKGEAFWECKLIPGRTGQSPLDYNPAYLQITSIPIGINLYAKIEEIKTFINNRNKNGNGTTKKGKTKKDKDNENEIARPDTFDDNSESSEMNEDDFIVKNIKQNCWPKIIDVNNNSHPGSNVQYEHVNVIFKIDNSTKLPSNFEIIPMKKHLYTSNMYTFNEKKQIIYNETIYDIINHFMKVRFEYYIKRKNYKLKELENDIIKNKNKMRFIKFKIEGLEKNDLNQNLEFGKYLKFENNKYTLDTRGIKKDMLYNIMEIFQFDKFNLNKKIYVKYNSEGSYEYITKSVTTHNETIEEYKRLNDEVIKKTNEYTLMKNTYVKDIWINELNILEEKLLKTDEKTKLIKMNNIGKECKEKKGRGRKK